jgi:hypothetical protein
VGPVASPIPNRLEAAVELHEEPVKILLDGGEGRSVGVHVSDVIRHLAFASGYLDKKWETADMDAPTVQLGLAWEEYYFKTYLPDVVHQPGELCCDGMYMTPDGFGTDSDGTDVLHEAKTTKKSKPKDIEDYELPKFWLWLTQMKAYCHGLGTTRARLHALFLNGSYDWYRGGTTSPQVVTFEFSKAEIRLNWNMLLRHKRDFFDKGDE